jgi:hypothetical protein
MNLNEALRKLKAAGRIRSEWLPGMCYRSEDGCSHWRPDEAHDPGLQPGQDRHDHPDTSDPATVGCLMALLREASGADDEERDLEAYVEPRGPASARWMVIANCAAWPKASTEGEAIAAALVQLAQEVC